METVTTLPSLPPRLSEANKGDFGRVLIIAGSRGMSGAAILCASSALRRRRGTGEGGACLARFCPSSPRAIRATPRRRCRRMRTGASRTPPFRPWRVCASCTMSSPSGRGLAEAGGDRASDRPGGKNRPADGDRCGRLESLSGHVDKLGVSKTSRIITPHPGEFARLLHTDVKTVQAQRKALAVEFAKKHALVVVLKGHGTIVTDGQRVYRNATGNPGMATGGTGDVLTGLIAAFVGQNLPAFEAAQLGVHVHGLAGDLARDQLGAVSLIATDLLDFLPTAIRQAVG